MKRYKEDTIKKIKEYIDVSANECCKDCEVCCEKEDCPLTQMLYGLSNVFGVNFIKEV